MKVDTVTEPAVTSNERSRNCVSLHRLAGDGLMASIDFTQRCGGAVQPQLFLLPPSYFSSYFSSSSSPPRYLLRVLHLPLPDCWGCGLWSVTVVGMNGFEPCAVQCLEAARPQQLNTPERPPSPQAPSPAQMYARENARQNA